jgi:multiple sugar transport system substrate-binding protein
VNKLGRKIMIEFKKNSILAIIVFIIFIGTAAFFSIINKKIPEVVTLVTSRWAGPHADFQRKVLNRYELETGIRVIQDDVDYSQLFRKQKLNLANKTSEYDLIWVQEIWLPEYVKAGYLRPLNPYFGQAPGFSLKNYKPGLIDINTYDGQVYGIPTMLQTAVVVYDKIKLKEAGLVSPGTWEEMLAVAKYFKAQGTGIAIPAKKGLFAVNIWEAMMYSNDGGYFDKAGKLSLDRKENIEALEYWQELMKYAMEGSLNWHADEVNKELQFGYAPVGITISGLAGILEDPAESKIAGNAGYSPVPYKQHPTGSVSIWSWCVPEDSKHPEEAFKLISWLTSAEVEKEQTLKNSQLSAVIALFDDEELKKKITFLPAVMLSFEKPHVPLFHEHAKVLTDGMMEILFKVGAGTAVPAEELEKFQQEMQGLF